MKRFIGSIRRSSHLPSQRSSREPSPSRLPDSPEAVVVREVIAFCETGQIGQPGDEYLHLPAIVDAAESSPAAARAAARQLHKYLSNPTAPKGNRQYNSIMLLRILTDNPGETFTRNIDSRFVANVKALLREGRDMGVQNILRETLESLTQNRACDENLAGLLAMWKKEKEKYEKHHKLSPVPGPARFPPTNHDYFVRQSKRRGLPPPQELAGRLSEANSSAKLLLQMVQSTPLAEFQQNELLKEFAHRCQAASKSLQYYINATDPAPDEDTMLTLIETNDKLSVSLSKYQRAALSARKAHPPQPENQPPLQSPNNPPAVDDAVPKNRFVPRLSMPRKPLRKKQPEQPEQPPVQQIREPVIGSTNKVATTSGGDVSPIAPVGATLFPQTMATTASTKNGTTDANRAAPPGGFQYNPDDFQIENPFADKFSTTNDTTNPNSHSGGYGDQARGDASLASSTGPRIGDLPLNSRPDDDLPSFQTYEPVGASQGQSAGNMAPAVTGDRAN